MVGGWVGVVARVGWWVGACGLGCNAGLMSVGVGLGKVPLLSHKHPW